MSSIMLQAFQYRFLQNRDKNAKSHFVKLVRTIFMLLRCNLRAARKQSLKLIMMEGLNVIEYLEQMHPFSNSFRAGLTDELVKNGEVDITSQYPSVNQAKIRLCQESV